MNHEWLEYKATNELVSFHFLLFIYKTSLLNAIYFFIPVSFLGLQIDKDMYCSLYHNVNTTANIGMRNKWNIPMLTLNGLKEYKWNITDVIYVATRPSHR